MQQAVIAGAFGLDHVKVVEAPEPLPGPGEVLVRMKAWSLNYRDYLVASGRYNPKMALPRVLLSDGAGEVLSDGARWKRGDRVAGIFMSTWLAGAYQDIHGKSARGGAIDGMAQELIAVPEDSLVAIPEHMSFEEGATLPCTGVTAWHALVEQGKMKAGDTVLLQGTGGLSLYMLQLAKGMGARVIATTSSEAKGERLKAMGADWVVNYKAIPDWGKVVGKAGGADHVIELGGAATIEQSLAAVRGGGRISIIGVFGGIESKVNLASVLHRAITVQGIYVGSREMFERLNRAVTQLRLKPVIDSKFELAQIQEALRYMESAGHFGKIVVTL
jgi:NADPH:quinone reductase-like Zn-dependent oxidoreductase